MNQADVVICTLVAVIVAVIATFLTVVYLYSGDYFLMGLNGFFAILLWGNFLHVWRVWNTKRKGG